MIMLAAPASAGVVEQATLVFTFALALALVIERLLEILKSLYDYIDGRGEFYHFWTHMAERARDYIQRRLRVFEYVDPKTAAPLMARFSEMMLGGKQGYDGEVPMISGDLVRMVWVRLATKLLGVLFGIVIAFLVNLDLIAWVSPKPRPPEGWSIALTGAVIGLGSGPVHKLITEIEKRRKQRTQEVARV